VSVVAWVIVGGLLWLLVCVLVVSLMWERNRNNERGPLEGPETVEEMEVDHREVMLQIRHFRRELREITPEDFEDEEESYV
jgi:hypothetical protein